MHCSSWRPIPVCAEESVKRDTCRLRSTLPGSGCTRTIARSSTPSKAQAEACFTGIAIPSGRTLVKDLIYPMLDATLTTLKRRPYRLDRRIPISVLVSLFSRRAIWLTRGILKTAFLQFRPKAVFMGPGVELRNSSLCRFGNGVTLERGVIIDGLSEHLVVLSDNVSIGPYSLIRSSSAVNVGAGMIIGRNSSCDAYSFFGAGGFVSIGENVIMGEHVSFHAETHNFERTDVPIRAQGVTMMPITVEDDCWIGANVTFLGGAYLARGSIVGAGAVVNKQYPPFSIIAGVPAKVLKMRGEAIPQD